MGQPNPPGDIPLVEGLGPEWNEFVAYIPEDKRAEFAPKFKEKISSYQELDSWRDLHKSGVTPDVAGQALNLYSIVENNPRQVYDLIGQSLGISAAEAKEVVEELDDQLEDDPTNRELQALRQQVETMGQIMLAQRNQDSQAQREAAAEQELENEFASLRKKYGDANVDEEQILMFMGQQGLSAVEAYQAHEAYVSKIRERRPAPTLLGGGGSVPNRAIDPTKLDNKGTKNLVAQMLANGNAATRDG